MILKKPYGFLIRYFKIIHIILAVLMSYLAFKIIKIVGFFADFASSGYFERVGNIAGSYVNLFMYFATILLLAITIFVYLLMKNKKKDTRFYVFLISYYIIVFVLLTVTFNILQGLEQELVEAQTARVYRDLSLLLSLPQYFFIVYAALRGFGFNLKKFNFQLDLKELDIEATDSEEVELTVGLETYKAKRYFRRLVREFKYYFVENTFLLLCIFAVIGIIIGTAIFLHFNVYNKVYSQNKVFTYKSFNIKVTDSYVTSTDYHGNQLIEGKYYLIVKVNVVNKINVDSILSLTDFRLKLNDLNIYPTKSKIQYFVDLGVPYKEDKIRGLSSNDYLLLYEIGESKVRSEYRLKVTDSVQYNAGDIKAKYKNVKVNPLNLDKIETIGTYKQSEKISLKDSLLKDSNVSINSYNITNNYKYTYTFCKTKDSCSESSNIITPNYKVFSNATLLVMDYELSLDKNTDYYQSGKNDFFGYFVNIRYEKDGKAVISNIKNITPKELNGKTVLQVDSNIKGAKKIELLITIRNKQYIVKLK